MKKKKELISLREYGRRRGCSDTAVRKALKAEKIVKGVEYDSKGRPRINPAIADEEWRRNIDPIRPRVAQKGKAIFDEGDPDTTDELDTEAPADIPKGAPKDTSTDVSLAAARRAQAVFKAKILELEMKQKQGSLVDRDQVYKALFAAGQEVRSALQSIPDRFIDNILAARSRNEAHGILANAIADALDKLADLGNKELTVRR